MAPVQVGSDASGPGALLGLVLTVRFEQPMVRDGRHERDDEEHHYPADHQQVRDGDEDEAELEIGRRVPGVSSAGSGDAQYRPRLQDHAGATVAGLAETDVADHAHHAARMPATLVRNQRAVPRAAIESKPRSRT